MLTSVQTGEVASIAADGDITEDRAIHGKENVLLAKLYILGEEYQDSIFKNAIIDAIMAKTVNLVSGKRWYLTGTEVDIIYRGTCPGSPARKSMVHSHAAMGDKIWVMDDDEEHNRDFLRDLCCKMWSLLRGEEVDFKTNCAYHEHKDGESCEK